MRRNVAGCDELAQSGRILLGSRPSPAALRTLTAEGLAHVVELRPPGRRAASTAIDLSNADVTRSVLPSEGDGLADALFDRVRRILADHRASAGDATLLLFGATAERAAALWLAARVLDVGVLYETALEEARRAGLRDRTRTRAARHYVLGRGKRELGKWKEKVRSDYADVQRIDVDGLLRRLDSAGAPLLLDVRAPREYAVSHLPGAQPAPELSDALASLRDADPDREVVVYCSIGVRSARMARALARHGHTNVRNLEGSIFEWANVGHPLVRNGRAVREVHPFDRTWGELLDPELWAWEPTR